MRATSALSFEEGSVTSWCWALAALRRRVRRSAMGSVSAMRSPARLRHAGDVAGVRQLAEADPAQAEPAVDRARATAAAAAAVAAGLELGGPLLADALGNLGHVLLYVWLAAAWLRPSLENGIPIASSRANASSSLDALVVMVMSRPRT